MEKKPVLRQKNQFAAFLAFLRQKREKNAAKCCKFIYKGKKVVKTDPI